MSQVALNRVGWPWRLRQRVGPLLLDPGRVWILTAQLSRAACEPSQSLWVVLLEILAPLGVFAWGRGAFLVCLVYGHMLVEDVECLLGGRELDGQDTFTVVDGLGGTFAQLGTLAVGSAVLVEERVVAVVGEAEAVVLPAVPTVVEAVAVSVDLLYRVDAALGDCPLFPHLLLGVRCRLQSLSYAQGGFLLRRLGRAIVGLDGLGEVVAQGEVGVREGLVLRRTSKVCGLVAGRRMAVLVYGVRLLLLGRRRRRVSCLMRLLRWGRLSW